MGNPHGGKRGAYFRKKKGAKTSGRSNGGIQEDLGELKEVRKHLIGGGEVRKGTGQEILESFFKLPEEKTMPEGQEGTLLPCRGEKLRKKKEQTISQKKRISGKQGGGKDNFRPWSKKKCPETLKNTPEHSEKTFEGAGREVQPAKREV